MLSERRFGEAESLAVRMIEMDKGITDEGRYTGRFVPHLALTYRELGRYKEAEELQVQIPERYMKAFGQEHLYVLRSMGELARTDLAQGRLEEAEKLQVQVLELSRMLLGTEHEDTLDYSNDLGLTYMSQGRWKEAEELQVQLVEASRKMGMPDVLRKNYMASLASNCAHEGRWKEAEDLQVQVLEISKKVLGVEHPHTLTYTAYLAAAYRSQHKGAEAARLEAQEKGEEEPD